MSLRLSSTESWIPVRRLALREAARMPELFALIYVHGATCAELLAVAEGARNP
jgi:hypothetical protein